MIRAVDREEIDFYGPDVALRNLSYAIAVFGTVASLCFHKASIDIPLGLRRRNKLAVTDLETLRRLTDLRPHTIKMWFVNALGCFAGISVISQAAVLLLSKGDVSVSRMLPLASCTSPWRQPREE